MAYRAIAKTFLEISGTLPVSVVERLFSTASQVLCACVMPLSHQGRSQRGGAGACPQSFIEWIFYGKNWLCWDVVTRFSLLEVFCTQICRPQICQKCVGDPAGENSRHSPRPPSRLRRVTPPPQSLPSSAPRFSRLQRSASVPHPRM